MTHAAPLQRFRALRVLAVASLMVFARSADASDDTLHLVSFNIRYDTSSDGDNAWSKRKDYVADVIRSYRADAIGLQEVLDRQLTYLLESLPEYDSVGAGRDDGKRRGEFSPILYRKDRLEVVESGTFWYSDTPERPGSANWGNEIPRICTWARFRERASGRTFYVYNTHFDHRSQPSRVKSAELLVERVQARAHPDAPAFLTGDFNAGEDNAAITAIRDAGFVDTYRALHPEAAEVGTFGGWAGKSQGKKIDYVFAPTGWEVVDATVDRQHREGRYPSDHYPVTAKLRW